MREIQSNLPSTADSGLKHFVAQGAIALGMTFFATMTTQATSIYMLVSACSMLSIAATQFFNWQETVKILFHSLLLCCYLYILIADLQTLSFLWCLCAIPTIIGLGSFKKAVISSIILAIVSFIALSGSLQNTTTVVAFSTPQLWIISVITLTTSLLSSCYQHDAEDVQAIPLATRRTTEFKDKLTGLFLRTYMEAYIDHKLSLLNETFDGLCIIVLDLDNFRAVNERYGHDSGNRALQSISEVIKDTLDKDYVIGRWDGNAFVIVSPHGDDQAALLVGELLRQKISDLRLNIKGDSVTLTCTLGIASCSELTHSSELLLDAENKLYRGKKFGGNLCVSN